MVLGCVSPLPPTERKWERGDSERCGGNSGKSESKTCRIASASGCEGGEGELTRSKVWREVKSR